MGLWLLLLLSVVPPRAGDEHETLLARVQELEAAKALKTASVLAYPAACGAAVPVKVWDSAAALAQAHGEPLMRAVWERRFAACDRGGSGGFLSGHGGVYCGCWAAD